MAKSFFIFLSLCVAAAANSSAEVLQLAAGAAQSAALVTGGDVIEWGKWGGPLPSIVFGIDHAAAIAAGGAHLLALKTDGTVWAWGSNTMGQLGNGTVIDSDRPSPVMDITGAIAIAAAGDQSYALKNDGTVWSWGANNTGLLGDGTTHGRRGPVVMEGLINVTSMAAGNSVFLAARKDGGVCTLGITTDVMTPDCTSTYTSVTAVAAENAGGYVLLKDGTVHALGTVSCSADFSNTTLILDDVHAISAGGTHLLLLRDDGTVWSCGSDQGRPNTVQGNLTAVTAISAGTQHSLAANSGGVWAWGDNSAGQLGTGNTQPQANFSPVWDGTGRLR